MEKNNKEVLLSLKGVKTYFPVKKGVMKKTVGYIKSRINIIGKNR